jgi:hypothetical protein
MDAPKRARKVAKKRVKHQPQIGCSTRTPRRSVRIHLRTGVGARRLGEAQVAGHNYPLIAPSIRSNGELILCKVFDDANGGLASGALHEVVHALCSSQFDFLDFKGGLIAVRAVCHAHISAGMERS